ncbi:MAG: penicillin-binding protein 1C, partial [Parvularculaceae bacterium]
GGRAAPLVWTPTEEAAIGGRLMSPESARLVGDILERAPAPPGRAPSRLSAAGPRVAFKTGTSYGRRDAWAAGYAGDVAVAVWAGRADGAARPGATGRRDAAPLLFELIDLAATPTDLAPTRSDRPNAARRARPSPARPLAIAFPANGAEIALADRGVRLAAAGGDGAPRWYVDGKPVAAANVWRPSAPGHYRIDAVDAAGATATALVRVREGFGPFGDGG